MNRVSKIICGLCFGILLLATSLPGKATAAEDNLSQLVDAAADIEHPQLVVESYEIVNGKFERSAECTLRIHIKNIDDSTTAIGGGVTFYSDFVFPVFGKTNQVVFGEVGPEESVYVDFDVNLDRIVNGPNVIELNFGWENENGTTFTNLVHISPVLLEEIGFDITSVKIPETIYGSKHTAVRVSYENIGAESLQNVYMILNGDLAQGMQVVELEDTLVAMQSEMVDYSLELLNMGENRVSVSFKYEDRNGTEYTTEPIEVIVNVTDKTYITPVEQEKDVKELLEEYRVYVVCAAVAVLLWIPYLISKIRKGGKRK